MTRPDRPVPTVAIAAAPRMLAEGLQALLADDAQVTVLLDDSSTAVDVLVTTPDGPSAPAALVIELDDSPGSVGGGRVLRDGVGADQLADLEAVLDRIRSVSSV